MLGHLVTVWYSCWVCVAYTVWYWCFVAYSVTYIGCGFFTVFCRAGGADQVVRRAGTEPVGCTAPVWAPPN